jgi:Heliorhodopsin
MATTTKKSTTKAKTKTAAKAKKPTAKKTSTKATKSNAKVTSKSTSTKVEKSTKSVSSKQPKTQMEKLKIWNFVLAFLHFIQGVAVIVLSSDALFPVTTNYLTTDALASTDQAPVLVNATRNLFDINLAYVVAAFFFMSAIAHLSLATWYRKKYEENLPKGLNKARWYEYGISASTMMIAIAMLSGVADLSTLVLIFGATLVMNLCGLIMEIHNQTTTKTNWISYVIGTIAGILPWVAVGIYLWGATQFGAEGIPGFVYAIYASLFVFFSCFAVNMYLQYKKKGKWADYIYGEKVYMILSLVAKSALAWQVFFGTLRP